MTRTCIANVIVGQMLPAGVVKGDSPLKMRYGRTRTRFTADLDAARPCDLASFLEELGRSLARGWNGFTGRLVAGRPAHPKDVPDAYVMQPFEVTETTGKFDVLAIVAGGGSSGQAGALKHGISRALLKSSDNLRLPLKKAGFLTRDPRAKERKKYGKKRARKSFQFSKR